MSRPVLPDPEKLHSTRNCELAAILYTMGFEPVDNPEAVTGDEVPGGRAGFCRFLPLCEGGRYVLSAALAHGTDPHQAAKPGTLTAPVYEPQAYMAAAFHNYRMLIEHLKEGQRLTLVPCGYLYLLQRCGRKPADTATEQELREFMRHGSTNTRFAAAMATLGFPLYTDPAEGRVALAHGKAGRVWYIGDTSLDGRWKRDERWARWNDTAWCALPENTDPIAAISDAFHNLDGFRKAMQGEGEFIRVQHGDRSIMVRRAASDATWQKAEGFLLGK